eukprot:SAG31_NODE_11223_length_1052_cov_1.606506_1_plen_161_part_00
MEKRRQVAEANRLEDEQRLRYRERLKTMPGVLQATERQMGIITELIGNRVRRPDYLLQQLTDEVQGDYALVINEMAFDATLPFSEDAHELPANGNRPGVGIQKNPAPPTGTLLIPWHDFEGNLDKINFSLPCANPLLLESIQAVVRFILTKKLMPHLKPP